MEQKRGTVYDEFYKHAIVQIHTALFIPSLKNATTKVNKIIITIGFLEHEYSYNITSIFVRAIGSFILEKESILTILEPVARYTEWCVSSIDLHRSQLRRPTYF